METEQPGRHDDDPPHMQSRPLRATAGLFPPQERHFTDATTRPAPERQRATRRGGSRGARGRRRQCLRPRRRRRPRDGRPRERRLLAPRRSGSGHPGALGEQE
ncbi:predicted protein [Streptomyces pristinaespiralis ATCC 25486]|uniref:Predicted protein n=1 Tax=Streptomyces pristinaespiralis (strain ATCC 25486 / DSM 40338 / CBS 914.69 / JCM 4507 / KCC S-0507 / NBRC 13074 / NRRL 2958 / 5647) TaxID=457429 RepID=D6X6U4_STRE2|nr:predicted protein [Streptomyces pristinaespiralis ATCC 25486]